MATFKVYNRGNLIGETVAETPEQACSVVRFRRFGLVRHENFDLVAMVVPQSIVVDVSDLTAIKSAVRFYRGARHQRKWF